MKSVATAIAIAIAIKPASAVAIAAKKESEEKGQSDTHHHLAWVITNGHVKVKEKIHAFPCQETEAVL